ncbi:MAG: type II toxin-antitoxin system RelE/ParE family toxin [Pirellulaceae bacterium]
MIRSFSDANAQRLFLRERVKKLDRQLQRAGLRKLTLLDAAESLDDLRAIPGNRLEKLVGDRAGQYSIRINDQWRICFCWADGDAQDVEIADYH